MNEDYTEWKIDPQKFAEIQERLELTSEETLLLIQMFREASDYETADEMKAQCNIILQRLTLMNVVGEVWVFRGEYEGEYPDISVSSGENGKIVIKYLEYKNVGTVMVTKYSNLGSATISIGETLLGAEINDNKVADMEYCFNSRFGNYFCAGETARFIVDEVYSSMVSEQLDKKIMGKAIGYIPIIGDGLGFFMEAAQEQAQADEDKKFLQEQFTDLMAAEIYSDFDCCANFVEYDVEGNSSNVIYAYAGERTDAIIAELNSELGFNWTREQMLGNANEIWEWIKEVKENENTRYIYNNIIQDRKRE